MIYLVSNNKSLFEDSLYKDITLEDSIEKLKELTYISTDTETSGLDCHSKKFLSLQLGNPEFQIVYDIESFNYKIPEILKEFLNNFTGTYILQNAKFDLQFFYVQDVFLKNIYDTMLAEYILTLGLQEGGRDLKTIVKKYCNEELDKSVRGKIITQGLSPEVIVYGARDVEFLETVMNKQKSRIKYTHMDGALKIDNEFVKCLAYIEYCGIKLDWEKWRKKANDNIEKVIKAKYALNQWLYDNDYKEYIASANLFSEGYESTINWDSPAQVIPLFEKIGIDCTVKVKGETKKTVEEKALKFQISKFPILTLYFNYKALQKIVSTYGLKWKDMINPVTGRIHTTYRQIMNTGRLSCGDKNRNAPNLQNLPNDAYTRSCFIAEPGNKFMSADYSAQESIVLANFAHDESLINFYRKGLQDMHSYVAFLLYKELQTKPASELTNDDLIAIKKNHHDLRQTAKTAEFAVGYGGNGSTIAKNTGCSKAQGEEVYKNYFDAFSGLKTYFQYVLNKTKQNGYIQYNPITGRKFFINPDSPFIKYREEVEQGNQSHSYEYRKAEAEIQRLSQNYPIQGSSADCSKLAGCLFFNQILKNGWFNKVKIVNMVHDEYCVEAPKEMANEVGKLLIQCMEKAGTYFCKTITLKADIEIGDYWIH